MAEKLEEIILQKIACRYFVLYVFSRGYLFVVVVVVVIVVVVVHVRLSWIMCLSL